AGVTDPTPGNNTATDTDRSEERRVGKECKYQGKTEAINRTPDSYTITVTNNGSSTVSGFTLTDTIPAGLLSATFGTPSAGSYNSTTGVWSGLSLASGQSVSISLSGRMDPGAIRSLTYNVRVSPLAGVTDPTPGNNTATDTD